MNQIFISSHKSDVDISRVSLEACQKCFGKVNSFQLVLWGQYSWDPTACSSPKISVKTVGTKPELIVMDLVICWTIRCLSSKTIQWMASTCTSVVNVFGQPYWRLSFVLSLPFLNSTFHFFRVTWKGESTASICIMSSDFLGCHTFLFKLICLLRLLFYPFLDLLHIFHLCMVLCSWEIKTNLNLFF